MQSRYGEETDDVAADELDLDGFFEDDIAPRPSDFTEEAGTGEAVYDNTAASTFYIKRFFPCRVAGNNHSFYLPGFLLLIKYLLSTNPFKKKL